MAATYQLRSAVWEITLACCFSCAYCGSKAGRARANELTTEECLRVVDELADLGCRRVSLIGGEVFMRRDWARVVEALIARGIRVCVITNGWLFSPDDAARLAAMGVESVAVSLDGPREVHDAYRAPGSHDRCIAAIRTLAQADVPVSVITTLNSQNAPLLEELYDELRTLPLFAWQLQACSPMGNAAEGGLDHRFDFRSVIEFVRAHRAEAPFSLGIADNIGYFPEAVPERCDDNLGLRGAPGSFFHGCSAGLHGIGIDSVGNVRGCESMYDERFIEGNLRERSLRSIWEDPNAFAYNRQFTPDLLTGACATCEMGRVCAAGCRSYNYFNGGEAKLYESPRCARMSADANR